MSDEFSPGQRVRIIRVDDIPYGLKYSYLAATMDKTGVVREKDSQSSNYIVRLDDDGSLISISGNCLEKV